MSPFELDRHIHRDLRRLPAPAAPAALLTRVMAARVRLEARPWYDRAWVTWPVGWRVASVTALAALVAALALTAPVAYGVATNWAVRGGQEGARLAAEYLPGLRASVVTVEAVWRAVVQPVAGYLLALLFLMWAACAAFGAALTRIAMGEVSRS